MTAEELREAAAVMLAAADGQPIQVRNRERAESVPSMPFVESTKQLFDWGSHEYRVKPEPVEKSLGQIAAEAFDGFGCWYSWTPESRQRWEEAASAVVAAKPVHLEFVADSKYVAELRRAKVAAERDVVRLNWIAADTSRMRDVCARLDQKDGTFREAIDWAMASAMSPQVIDYFTIVPTDNPAGKTFTFGGDR